ncbi:DUF4383 domain-containing protein [Actinocrinis puniceicyclus]|uniref:DUF4383 domain-containing protein n=1 Tax=Actinocrinis puniceicyclus TaxID=977794 RepID=A0A8J8BEP5_9ACTN|nr:DUF4383 domain-containing protein [Actinocrinis puniceicyclus]MBS2965376.1 DUF4383 domain-containing protein [Actinocrinis puniceicyclus]
MKLQDQLPVDYRLGTVYRYGAGLTGVLLLAFGSLGFADDLAFFSTSGQRVAGLSSNGLLSAISIAVAALLIGAAALGGNTASNVNTAVGTVFLGSGFVNLALLDTQANFLAFRMQNVLFSFVVGLMLLTFGMYGRVSGGLPHDNPYWRARHPEQARREAAPAAPSAAPPASVSAAPASRALAGAMPATASSGRSAARRRQLPGTVARSR